jgi:hypothetical protein
MAAHKGAMVDEGLLPMNYDPDDLERLADHVQSGRSIATSECWDLEELLRSIAKKIRYLESVIAKLRHSATNSEPAQHERALGEAGQAVKKRKKRGVSSVPKSNGSGNGYDHAGSA